MTVTLADKVAFLRSLSEFDHVGECIETHLSFVFLTEHRALKLKKPVRLPFVDHTQLEDRRRDCEKELVLGRRLGPSVYEQVVPLVVSRDGLAIDHTDGGAIVDWLVVMRRLDSARMLPQMLLHNAATPAHADAVGDVLAAFYRRAPRAMWNGPEYRRRLRDMVVGIAEELVERGESRARLDAILQEELGALEEERRTLAARIVEGRVVDGHGDLRPEHICLEQPPVIIDPLEFDDDLRTIDPVSELAFFALECDLLGASWFADRVFERYLEMAADRVGGSLVALYRRQHALVRALLALRHLDDAAPSDHWRWHEKADQYLWNAACNLARP
jgi:aminoglycoside phosphotransferase family enzyme